jgi:pSer/pThr/pTyr-binding forkhead associated (FHA) protein
MSSKICPSCHMPAPAGAIFCDNCGYDLRTVGVASSPPLPVTQLTPQAPSEIICPSCRHSNIVGAAFCENCGSQLTQLAPPEARPTPPEAETPSPYEAPKPPFPPQQPAPRVVPPTPPSSVDTLVDEMTIVTPPVVTPIEKFIPGRLVIQSSNISIPIPSGKDIVVIGREDPVSGIFPEIDLDPHGGHEAGVGRRHAQLLMRGGQVLLEDLDSVNGTVINKVKLLPNHPQPLQDGDEVRLGKMVIIYMVK